MSQENHPESSAPVTNSPSSVPASQDPWSSTDTSNTDPWGNSATSTPNSGSDWLNTTDTTPVDPSIDWIHPFQDALIPFDQWVEDGINWLVVNFRPAFQAISVPIDYILTAFQATLQSTPALLMIFLIMILAWQIAGLRMGIASVISMLLIGAIGAWDQAMVTLALVLTSVFFCLLIGLPTGIWLARSEKSARIVRPILDAMQTTPAFVYLVPIVMLFGIGNVPGVVVTIIFALPPIIRLTILGIRQVPEELIEAAHSFGANPKQMLYKVQLPLAMPTIMAGVNQTLMLALSMVVIASMIAVGGLGQMVLRGIGRLDMGLAAIGGLGIVILAILLDRLTQAMGASERGRSYRHWYEHGPIGFIYRRFKKDQAPHLTTHSQP